MEPSATSGWPSATSGWPDGSEEPVDVDLAEAASGREVLLGGEILIANHGDAVLEERSPDSFERLVVDTGREVDAEDLGSQRPRDRPDLHLRTAHRHISKSDAARVGRSLNVGAPSHTGLSHLADRENGGAHLTRAPPPSPGGLASSYAPTAS